MHALNHLLIRLQHLHELLALFDFDRGVSASRESYLAVCLIVIHDLVGEADKSTVLGHEVDYLLTSNIKYDQHWLVEI